MKQIDKEKAKQTLIKLRELSKSQDTDDDIVLEHGDHRDIIFYGNIKKTYMQTDLRKIILERIKESGLTMSEICGYIGTDSGRLKRFFTYEHTISLREVEALLGLLDIL